MTSWTELPITEQHAAHLESAAITPEVAAAAGIRSARTVDELPEHARSWGEQVVPAIVFPWRSSNGRVVEQVRPDVPVGDQKYLWPKGEGAVLNEARPVTEDHDSVLIVEGTKQTWAAVAYAPANVAVYGIGGCRNWSTDGVPSSALMAVEGRKAVIALDADSATNLEVYTAGVDLAVACDNEGAKSVTFLRLGAKRTTGLDDVLAARPENTRAGHLERLIAKAKAKPADKLPDAKQQSAFTSPLAADENDRPVIYMDGDRLDIVNEVTDALLKRWNATRLFCHGDKLSQLKGQVMEPLVEGSFLDILAQTARTAHRIMKGGEQVGIKDAWADGATVKVVQSRADRFTELDLIARSPFVRPDGTICRANGYDEATRTMVVMDPELVGIEVPDEPSDDEVSQARKLILDEWLGDFPFPDEANRANALALVITPFVRSMMYVAPLAVVDGLAPGVGKNLLVDCILLMFLGEKPQMMGWNANDDELRKTITSAFMTGPEVMVFDEAHRLDGPSLARALTAAYWKDRLLGGNSIKGYPNRATWISLGNNVRIEGDIFRRVYQIALRPPDANPEDRDTHSFRHPQLEDWTKENRAELIRAALVLVRAWFAAGKPRPADAVTFGSFEKWAETLGGIVQVAGQPGFLGNLKAWRSESNLDAGHWSAHLAWLFEKFGATEFMARDVRAKLMADVEGAEYPPLKSADIDNKASYPKALGEAYHSIRDRSWGGYRIVRPIGLDGKPREARGGRALWSVATDGPAEPTSAVVPSNNPNPNTDEFSAFDSPNSADSDALDSPNSAVVPESEGMEGEEGAPNPTHTRKTPSPDDAHDARVSHVGAGCTDPSIPSAPSNRQTPAENDSVEPAQRQNSGCSQIENRHYSGTTAESGLAASEEPWAGVEQPSLFSDPEPSADPAPAYTAVDLTTWTAEGEIDLPEGVVVFDIESTGPQLWPAETGFIRITGVQQGKTIRVYEDAAEVADLLRSAKLIVGHNLMSFDLLAFALHHGVDIHEMAEQGRLVDTMLTEVVVNPPEARTKQGQIMRTLGLDALGAAKELGAKSHDLKALAKEFGGFDQIPTDDDRYVTYCAQDVNLTAKIALDQRTTWSPEAAAYAKREHQVAAIAAQIRLNGFRVDRELLAERVAAGEALRTRRLDELQERYGLPMTLPNGKPAKSPHATKEGKAAIERAFADLGVELGRTKSGGPAFGKEARDELLERFATRPDVLELLDTVGSLLGIRSVYGTVERCLVGDRVHPDITMFQASGRWSITEPGLTVMGKRGGKHVEREIFLPEPGHVIISADLSQVDARAVAAWCQDPGYLELFDPGRDSHTEIALAVWNDAGRRDEAKVLGHGWNYGMGIAKLAAKIGDEDTAREFDRAMKERYPGLVAWKQDVAAQADSGELLDNGFGRRLRTTPGFGWTQGPALMGQSAARDILMHGLLRMPRELYPYLRAVVHDEVVMSIPAERADGIETQVMEALTFPWAPREGYRTVNIEAGLAKRGENWGACYAK
jgi:DNA polymerase I-like protein with 3'-5' exonuclease and polymerase domains